TQVEGSGEVGSAILQDGGIDSLITIHTHHLHVSRDRASIQNVIAIDDHVPVHASAVLVEGGSPRVIAGTDCDAIGGSGLTTVDIVFAPDHTSDRDTANIVVAPVLDKPSGG